MFCSNCGKTIPKGDDRCPACGCPNGEGSFVHAEFTSVQMHVKPGRYEQVVKTRTKGVTPADAYHKNNRADSENARAGYVRQDEAARRSMREVGYTEDEYAAEREAARDEGRAEYSVEELSDAARESVAAIEAVSLDREINLAQFQQEPVDMSEVEEFSEDVNKLLDALDARAGSKQASKKKEKSRGKLRLPFGKKGEQPSGDDDYDDDYDDYDEDEYAEEDYAEEDYVDEDPGEEEYFEEEYAEDEYAEDEDYAEQDGEPESAEVADIGEEASEEGESAAEADEFEPEDEVYEEEYAEGEEDYEDYESEEDYGDEEEEYADEYAEEYADEYDDYDEEGEDEERAPLDVKKIVIIAAIVLAVVALVIGGVVLIGGKAGGGKAKIEGVDKTLYTNGISLIKRHRSDENIRNVINSANGDLNALNSANKTAANEITMLTPAEASPNELLFLSALQKIETDIANSLTTDVLTGQGTPVSLQNWQTVDNAIGMLDVATSADALNAIINGTVVSPAELQATPTPEPAVNQDMLSKGDSGDAVLKLQNRLYELGYLSEGRDGSFGSGTQTAVKLFQQANGLTVTGVADSETLELVYSDDAKKTEYAPG